jgi:hypothetical protein
MHSQKKIKTIQGHLREEGYQNPEPMVVHPLNYPYRKPRGESPREPQRKIPRLPSIPIASLDKTSALYRMTKYCGPRPREVRVRVVPPPVFQPIAIFKGVRQDNQLEVAPGAWLRGERALDESAGDVRWNTRGRGDDSLEHPWDAWS